MMEKKEAIAELLLLLPMFMGTVLEGGKFKTATGLNISEEKTLMYIYKHRGCTMTGYSERVGLARGSFTTVADSLEERGLVDRVFGSDDRRKCALVLTEKGENIAREINLGFKKHIAARLERLTEGELSRLKDALETIAAIMEKLKDRKNQ